MRYIPLVVALSALALAASVGAADSGLLASRRGGWIEAIDPKTLETVSRIRVPEMSESVASDTSGQRLFVAAPRNPGKVAAHSLPWTRVRCNSPFWSSRHYPPP